MNASDGWRGTIPRLKKGLNVLVAGLLLLALTAVSGVTAEAAQPPSEVAASVATVRLADGLLPQAARSSADKALFNIPRVEKGTKAQQYTIVDEHLRLIKSTRRGDSIIFAFYWLDIIDVQRELVRADRRGVVVRGVVDPLFAKKAAVKKLRKAFKRGGKSKRSQMIVYKPVRKGALMHQKWMTVYRKGHGTRTIIGSANLSGLNAYREANDAVALSNLCVHQFLVREFERLRSGRLKGNSNRTATCGKYFLAATPQSGRSFHDRYFVALAGKKSWIRHATMQFSDVDYARLLVKKRKAGLKVQVLLNYTKDRELKGRGATPAVLKILRAGKVEVRNSMLDSRDLENLNHFKFTTVDGKWNGRKNHVMATGSLHPSKGSQRVGAQLYLRLDDDKLTRAYAKRFDGLWKKARKL